MKATRSRFLPFITMLWTLFTNAAGIFAQNFETPQIPDDAVVTVIGGGGFSIENEIIYNGGGMDDFGTVYSAAGDLTVTLKEVYITDNLTVITMALKTFRSASNHVFSGAVYINGEQKTGGGGAGESTGEPFESTMTLVFYGRLFDTKSGADWDNLRISFDGLIFAAYQGEDNGFIGVPEGYNWSFVFHNPDISRYNNNDSAATVDENGIHTFGDHFEIEMAGFSSAGDLSFDIVQKSELLNTNGSQNTVWINDQPRGAGGSSISFDGDGIPEVEADTKFIQTDHFLYLSGGESINPDRLAVWARGITVELTESGTPRTWTQAFSGDLFPMKLVQFYNID